MFTVSILAIWSMNSNTSLKNIIFFTVFDSATYSNSQVFDNVVPRIMECQLTALFANITTLPDNKSSV